MSQTERVVGPRLNRRRLLQIAGYGTAGAWVASLAGCSTAASGSSGPLLFVYAQGTVAERHVAVIEQYNKQHPSADLQLRYVNQPSYDAQLSTQIAGGNAPAVFEVGIETQEQYISRGVVRKLNDLVPDVLPFDRLPPSLQDYCKYRGDWYLIPTGVATKPAVVYNTAVLDQLGIAAPSNAWTMDELATMASRVHSSSGGKLYGITDLSGNDWALSPYLRGLGKSLFTRDGKLGFDEGDLTSWFEFWDAMRKSGGCGPMSLTVESGNGKLQASDQMVTGTAAITLASSSKGLLGLQSLVKDELGLVPFPRQTAGGPVATVVRPIEWFVLSSKLDAAQAKAAAEACFAMVDDEKSLATLDLAHGVPLFADTRNQMSGQQTGINKLIFDDVRRGLAENPPTEYPYPPGAPELLNQLSTQAQAIGFGKTGIAEAVQSTIAQASTLLG